jgi:hypothetical protein
MRRRKQDVGDVEHVVLPVWKDLAGDDIFSSPVPTNLFLREMDRLRAAQRLAPKDNGEGKPACWGEKHRVCTFTTMTTDVHDVYVADAESWIPLLVIRTGPAELSKRLVTMLRRNGYRQDKGYVWWCETCGCDRFGPPCKVCGGTGLAPVQVVSVPDEPTYFKLAGVPFAPPEARR